MVLFHPSWNYFLQRYDIEVAGLIEPFPGQEATPKYLKNLLESLTERKVKAVFTEPQLPKRPAELVVEAGKLPLVEIDPLVLIDW